MKPAPVDVSRVEFKEVDAFPAFGEIEHGQLFSLSLTNSTTPLTHGLHRFPAKFIPQVPAWALDQFAPPGGVVLDPFMGSGTTLVEGLTRDVTVLGVDIDPLANLITLAKVSLPEVSRIVAIREELLRNWDKPAEHPLAPMQGVRNFRHWFAEPNWSWLSSLWGHINTIPMSAVERTFLQVVFSSILRWVSNADDQSQKTYVSGTLPKTPPEVRPTFSRVLARAVSGLEGLHARRAATASARVLGGDATEIPLSDRGVDLIVSSPPYLDSVDYMYNFMVEYFWLGPSIGVPDRETFNTLRRRPIGAKLPLTRDGSLPSPLQDVIPQAVLGGPRGAAVADYFRLMLRHFAEASRCLRDGGRYVLVAGNSQTKAAMVPVHDALIRLAHSTGLELERAFGYRIRRHYMKFPRAGRGGIILIDWVLVLRKARQTGSQPPQRLPLHWLTLSPTAVAH